MKNTVMLALAAALFAAQSGTAIAQQPAKQPSPAQQAQSDFPPDYIDLSGETAKDSTDDEPDYDRPWYKQFTILGMDVAKVDIKTFAQKIDKGGGVIKSYKISPGGRGPAYTTQIYVSPNLAFAGEKMWIIVSDKKDRIISISTDTIWIADENIFYQNLRQKFGRENAKLPGSMVWNFSEGIQVGVTRMDLVSQGTMSKTAVIGIVNRKIGEKGGEE